MCWTGERTGGKLLDGKRARTRLSLGRRGQGRVWPNPSVGCVVVKNGRVAGRGWTADGGRPHAEVCALEQAGEASRGATAYVSLEPCAHHGKTPPCANALLAAGDDRVLTAIDDPHPRVSGAGHPTIREAGIALETGVCKGEAARDHAGFLLRVRNGRPLVTLKLALSIDGRIATASGESQWITGPAARRIGHVLRASHDAVLVGGGTARADNPRLTVRGLGQVRQPVRVVASSALNLPAPLRLVETLDQSPVWVMCGEGADARRADELTTNGARLLRVRLNDENRLDPKALLERLGAEGLTRVYCEGGGELAASLLRAGLVDRIAVFSAGIGLGGDALPGLGDMGLSQLSEATRFRLRDVRRVGSDTMTVWERPL